MSRRDFARATTLPIRCLRCGGELPEGHGYYHLDRDACIEKLRGRIAEIESFLLMQFHWRPSGGALDRAAQAGDRR